MPTNEQRRAVSRAKLVSAARANFTKNGYSETFTDEILEQAGLSRGAMYHQFRSKKELFEAVFEEAYKEAIELAGANIDKGLSPLNRIINFSLAWLKVVQKQDLAVIILELGPQVLGWQEARKRELKLGLGSLTDALENASKAGEVNVISIDLSAKIIYAMLGEVALEQLYNKKGTTREERENIVRQFIQSLCTKPTDFHSASSNG